MEFNNSEFRLEDLDRVMRDSEHSLRDLTSAMDGLSEIIGEGESRSGTVSARVDANGRVTEVKINPRGMRLDSETLSEEIVEALQAAQDSHESQMRELVALPLGGEDALETMQRQFQELQDSFAAEISEGIARMERLKNRDHRDQ
ncbi:YbaB/EbfC family nucleoid-associated protein [Streptosporangium sp. NPDC000396]|uniref:YbaB/EbfC family nucleoid-associated protein n=1 Tax=Streptosporangium sp. NPDC000396 TaxID=3366185 RepID=UPI00368C67F0